jgi:hypothetical protein
MTLADLKTGQSGKILKISVSGALKRRLMDMGVVPVRTCAWKKWRPWAIPSKCASKVMPCLCAAEKPATLKWREPIHHERINSINRSSGKKRAQDSPDHRGRRKSQRRKIDAHERHCRIETFRRQLAGCHGGEEIRNLDFQGAKSR